MKLPARFLTRSGIVIAVSAVIVGTSAVQAANMDAAATLQKQNVTMPQRPSSDGPLEERIKRAIEEIDQKGQAALEELGELDSTEKVDQAEQILAQMERASREVKKHAHDRTAERLEELNDIAVARARHQAHVELRDLGELDTQEKHQRAHAIRARLEQQRERLADRWSRLREQMQRRHQQRALPEFTFRQPDGRPPAHAPAFGIRARLEGLTEEEVEAAVRQFEREARTALENLGELDTPVKIERARIIRARLAERIKDVREKLADRARDQYEEQMEQQIQRLRQRAEAAVRELGELDTADKQERAKVIRSKFEEQVRQLKERLAKRARNEFNEQYEQQAMELRRQAQAALEELGEADTREKQELARHIRARLEEELSGLRERSTGRAQLALQDRVEQEASELRQRAQAALERLGELDTPEKQEMARRIRAGLEAQVKSVRVRLSHQVLDTYDEKFEQGAEELRQRAQAALRELGRLDSMEKLERARQIRARLDDDINLLKRDRARQLRDGMEHRFDLRIDARPDQVRDALTDRARDNLRTELPDQRNRAGEIQDRTADALRQHQEHRDQLNNRVNDLQDRLQDQTRQVIRQHVDPPRARPEPRPAADKPPATSDSKQEPKPADERPASDDAASDSNTDGSSRDRDSDSRP